MAGAARAGAARVFRHRHRGRRNREPRCHRQAAARDFASQARGGVRVRGGGIRIAWSFRTSRLDMEIEYWWLLALPLFFALGWAAARIDIKHLVSESRALPASYFKGLNFLLNEQPDKAIEAFIEVVKVEPETIELPFDRLRLPLPRSEKHTPEPQ